MDDWWYHWSEADGVTFQTTAPYSANASKEASDLYAKFAYAAESHLLETFPDATPGHFGRASKIFFKKVAATFQNETGHIFVQPKVSFWEHLGGRLRLMKGLLKMATATLPSLLKPARHLIECRLKSLQTGLRARKVHQLT